MTNYEKYDKIFESLQEKLEAGELTIEQAESLNDMAYDKYVVTEGKKSDVVDMLEDLADKVKDGDITLPDELVDSLKELLGSDSEKEDDDNKNDDDSDDKEDESSEEE